MGRSFYGRTGVEFNSTLDEGIRRIKDRTRPRVVKAVLAAAELVRSRAYDLANVSPGVHGHAVDGRHMRDCIEVGLIQEPGQVSARIGIDMSNVPYAHHQEFGPNGKPFLRPAIDESRHEAHEIMREAFDDTSAAEVSTAVRFRRFA